MFDGNSVYSKATTINFVANQWVHVVATRINGTMKIYLNAIKEGETSSTNSQFFYPDLYLGGHATFNRWCFRRPPYLQPGIERSRNPGYL
jgi:hypothetical protein